MGRDRQDAAADRSCEAENVAVLVVGKMRRRLDSIGRLVGSMPLPMVWQLHRCAAESS